MSDMEQAMDSHMEAAENVLNHGYDVLYMAGVEVENMGSDELKKLFPMIKKLEKAEARAEKLESAWKDEKLRADTIHSRIQEVNDALLVAEDRIQELESEIKRKNEIFQEASGYLNRGPINGTSIFHHVFTDEGAGK
tara:strand:+ start:55 stop:465 length:411 start_codon:yes stop_codon:yes gene_type:complete